MASQSLLKGFNPGIALFNTESFETFPAWFGYMLGQDAQVSSVAGFCICSDLMAWVGSLMGRQKHARTQTVVECDV